MTTSGEGGNRRTGLVEANGVRLHYTRTGDGPPLVLAHGFSDDGTCWAPVAAALAGEYDVVMFDARGHGRSEAPPAEAGYGAAEQAADLAGAVAALGLERPVVLGHSMGAMTALALAGTYPAVPRAILLEDPPAVWVPDPEPRPPAPNPLPTPPWLAEMQGKTREELIEAQRAKTPHWSEAELGPWADSKLRFLPSVGSRGPGAPVDWPAVLRRIACPALLITGDRGQGALVSPEAASALRDFVPQARIAHVAGAGHSVRRDRPEEFLAAVRAFLREI